MAIGRSNVDKNRLEKRQHSRIQMFPRIRKLVQEQRAGLLFHVFTKNNHSLLQNGLLKFVDDSTSSVICLHVLHFLGQRCQLDIGSQVFPLKKASRGAFDEVPVLASWPRKRKPTLRRLRTSWSLHAWYHQQGVPSPKLSQIWNRWARHLTIGQNKQKMAPLCQSSGYPLPALKTSFCDINSDAQIKRAFSLISAAQGGLIQFSQEARVNKNIVSNSKPRCLWTRGHGTRTLGLLGVGGRRAHSKLLLSKWETQFRFSYQRAFFHFFFFAFVHDGLRGTLLQPQVVSNGDRQVPITMQSDHMETRVPCRVFRSWFPHSGCRLCSWLSSSDGKRKARVSSPCFECANVRRDVHNILHLIISL